MVNKLSPDDQKKWMNLMIGYANYVSVADNDIVGISKVVQDNTTIDKTDKDAILASCQAMASGFQKVYLVFKTGYTDAQAGTMPNFSPDTPPAPLPPGAPILPASYVPWFQQNWKGIDAVLVAVGTKSSDLQPLIPGLTSSGDQLLGQLNKTYPPGKKEASSVTTLEGFPVLTSLQ